MNKIVILAVALLMTAPPAFAADDGGFGSIQFPARAPAALGDYVAGDLGVSPADIEPAAGEEEAPASSVDAAEPAVPSAADENLAEPSEPVSTTDHHEPVKVETPDSSAAPQE